MNFDSFIFFVFFLSGLSVYYALNKKYRLKFLLLLSLTFISFFNISSLVFVVISSLSTFYFAKLINKSSDKRKIIMNVAVATNVALMVSTKYFSNINFSLHWINFQVSQIVYILGISFYSIQNISYIIDVYYKKYLPEKNIIKYLTYNAYFPKLLSGPIEKPDSFLLQFSNENSFIKENIILGFQKISLGIMKKFVLADRISFYVKNVFDAGIHLNGMTLITGIYLFTIQLYFDFSGYIDIAIGVSKCFGYELSENFNQPILKSTSISEFWRRWHITLMNFFRNYIYYPLHFRFRKLKKFGSIIAVFATFVASAIWHGTGLNFLIWALLHFIYLTYENLIIKFRTNWNNKKIKVYTLVSIFITFNLVCFSNIFFRSTSFINSKKMLFELFSFSNFLPKNFTNDFVYPLSSEGTLESKFNLLVSVLLIFIYFLFENKIQKLILKKEYNLFIILIFVIITFIFGYFNQAEKFIYMQF